MAMYVAAPESIVLRRSDFLRLHDYCLNHAPLRDFCLVRVPMRAGLRPGEIKNLRWEDIDFENRTLLITDSKKHAKALIPVDPATLDYLQQLHELRPGRFGWVIERETQGRMFVDWPTPLCYDDLDRVLKKWARAAGCEGWKKISLYDLRHFFAANWAYPADGKRPGNLHALSKILRHKSLAVTQIYLSRLVFFEDIQTEYNRLQSFPFSKVEPEPGVPSCGNEFFDKHCRLCMHVNTCKFMPEAMACTWAKGCKHYAPQELKVKAPALNIQHKA